MLGELKRLNSPGRKEELLFFLQSIIGDKTIQIDDIRVLCTHAPARYQLYVDYLIEYCISFGWILYCDGYSVSKDILEHLGNDSLLNTYLIESTLDTLFRNKILTAEMFVFDINEGHVLFRNELLPLTYAPIRNDLVSQSFFAIEREQQKTCFLVNPDFENKLSSFCQKSKQSMTLEQLQSRLESNAIAGAKAESFVLNYERQRINNPNLQKKIRQISNVDVCAGYDILSFENDSSTLYDRFIEVKAVSRDCGFFWSKNELKIAQLQGDKYFLYLVNLSQIGDAGYCPMIIQNPAHSIVNSPDWLVEPESYHIQAIQFQHFTNHFNGNYR